MTITNGYCTLAEIKERRKITSTNAGDDTQIEDMVEAASRYIDDYTSRRFHSTTADETRTFNALARERCYPGDLLSITTLKTDDDGDRTYENTWAVTDYDLMPTNAALDGLPYTIIQVSPDGDYSFPRHTKAIQIVGKFGYSTTAPASIKAACISIVLRMYQNRFGQTADGQAIVTAAGSVIMPSDIPSDAITLLNPFRRFS